MDIAYAKVVDCVDIVPSLADVNDESARLEATLAQSLLDVSRLIESELNLPVNYFQPAPATPTDRTFYSDGTQFVRLAPYVELVSVSDSDANVIDTDYYFVNSYDIYNPRSYYLRWQYRSCGSTWWRYSPITVNARWGFPCIPPDIVLAVKSMACLMFLVNAQGRAGLESGLDANQEQRLRSTYGKVVDSWLDKFHHYKNLGIG